ncbi:MAG: T9SS type A sorting domain-containing protein [candidate division WOR-3 bacterium]|nr:MAG: T9SS type A sorting domain-containing protein [candidate division WOR-3 bacterium]
MICERSFKSRLVVVLYLGFVMAFAQYPDTLWSRIHSISPAGDVDDGKCISQTVDGGYVITGACVPNGMVSAADVLLLKTDSLGIMQWVKSFGIEFMDEGFSVEQTFDGGYIIGGRALFITGPNPNSDNQSDIWLIKTDSNGDTVWTRTYGGSGHDYCTWTEQTADSGYVLCGTMNSGRSYPPTCFLEYTQSATECAFLMKTDPIGEIVWTKTYEIGSYGNYARQTVDGGYILVGIHVSNDQPDIYLVKTDSIGDTLWTKTIGSLDSLEFGKAIQVLPDGYVIGGHVGPMPLAGVDGLLVRTDLSGDVLWTNSYGDSLSDVINAVEVAPDGSFFLFGNTNCLFHVHTGNMWVFSTDAQGSMLWQRTYDFALNDYCWSSATTSDGCYAVAGFLGYPVGGDLWQAKIGVEPGIEEGSENDTRGTNLSNHPNPFNGSTNIYYVVSQPDVISIVVYDVLGRKIETLVNRFQDIGEYSVNFDASNIPGGTYFCELRVGDVIVANQRLLLIR